MSYRNANYSAFYVSEPFSESNLGANSTHDFVYYNMLRMWRGEDNSFPFNDAHDKTYNVRDGSDWEKTLKPRLHTIEITMLLLSVNHYVTILLSKGLFPSMELPIYALDHVDRKN